jgi:S1-C subfamily serine protease
VARRRLGAGLAVATTFALAVGIVAGTVAWRTAVWRAQQAQPVASVQGLQADRADTVDPGLAGSVRSSLALIDSEGCGERRQGTTTLVEDEDGPMALTNQHVVLGTDEAELAARSGEVVEVPVRERVTDRDAVHLDPAALLDDGVTPLPIGPRPIVGAVVMVAGFPGGGYQASVGHVERVERRHGYGGTVDMLIIDVEATPGISGGVVVDSSGRAVGLVAARDPETGDTVAYPLDTLSGSSEGPNLSC